MGKAKIKQMSAEKVEQRREAKAHDTMIKVAAVIGLPEAQRDHHRLGYARTAVDGKARPLDRTLRKLTRAELLERNGAITKNQLAAISFYVEQAEKSGSVVQACNYGGTGGSSPTSAAAGQHATMILRAIGSLSHDRVRGCLPKRYIAAFEAIVLDNAPVMTVGEMMFPGTSRGYLSGAMRQIVQACADHIHVAFEAEIPLADSMQVVVRDQRNSLLGAMVKMDRRV